MKTCQHCGATSGIEDHHINPKCHFGRRNNGKTAPFCRRCHDRLEDLIMSVESFIGNVKFGNRFKLHPNDYEKIVFNFSKRKFLPDTT